MNFPGVNKLELSDQSITEAIERALNGTRRDGEDYVRVTDISRSYSYGPWVLTITTDVPETTVTALQVAA